MNILEANRQRDLYLLDPETNRIVFAPHNWCDELRQDDEDDGPCFTCYFGNPDVLAFQQRESREWLTTDAQLLFSVESLEAMREVSEQEARQLDPDLFTLLAAINSGEAK